MKPTNQTTGEEQAASFVCSSCGAEFPRESSGKVNRDGKPLCIPCSLKMTSETAMATTKENHDGHKARVEASVEKREKEKGSQRWIAALLLIAIPVIAFEVFLMYKNKPAELTTAEAAEIELSECMIMMTVLGQYYDEHGQYPPDLEILVPEFWSSTEANELQRYQYTRIGIDNFRLEKSGSALPAPLISRALDDDLLPATLTAETDLDNYLDRAVEEN